MKDWFEQHIVDDERERLRVPSLLAWLFAVALAVSGLVAYAQEAPEPPALLVADARLKWPYRGSVLLAAPLGDRHIGVILNRPTPFHMAQIFPGDEASQRVKDPVYFGGPEEDGSIFALVRKPARPHPGSFALGPGVWLVVDEGAINALMAEDPNQARYFAGVVLWAPGELAAELAAGMFHRRPLDPGMLFLPDTSGLWDELAPPKGGASI